MTAVIIILGVFAVVVLAVYAVVFFACKDFFLEAFNAGYDKRRREEENDNLDLTI